ncbi:MAG: glycosyltransferase family 9 protein, partial [Planctomycetota bacterium]
MRILIVRLSALGDVVTGLHALAAIKARPDGARVDWLVEDRFADLLRGHPQLDRLLVYPRRALGRPSGVARLAALVLAMRRARYDVALDLQGNLKSGVLARLSGARRLIGLAPPHSREGNGIFVRTRLAAPPGNRVGGYLRLVEEALGPGPAAPALLPATPQLHRAIVLHPGTSRFGAFKRWPARSYAELGDRLAARLGAPVLLTAGP